MKRLFKIQEKIVPELVVTAQERYNILRGIYYNQPVGRRALARILELSERKIRNDLDFFEKMSMIDVTPVGTRITKNGEEFLLELDDYIKELRNLRKLEEDLKELLGLKKVYLINGSLAGNDANIELSRQAAAILKNEIKAGDILAVTGGNTLASVADKMSYTEGISDITVVPGRGGLGEDVELQANTVAARIAKKLGGHYHLLHIPDNIGAESFNRIISEPSILNTMQILKNANILIHGVGDAEDMARRRGMTDQQINKILEVGAVSEAFGFYFNSEGEIVYSTTSVGLTLADLKNIDKVIVVAGGTEKAKAIMAAVSPEYQDILITDEITARRIIKFKGGGASS